MKNQDYENLINTGLISVFFGAYLSNWNGYDTPSIALEFLDENDTVLFSTDTISSTLASWILIGDEYTIPASTKKIKYIMMGERFNGTDNDSYIDETFLKLNLSDDPCSYYLGDTTSVNMYQDKLFNLKDQMLLDDFDKTYSKEAVASYISNMYKRNYRLDGNFI